VTAWRPFLAAGLAVACGNGTLPPPSLNVGDVARVGALSIPASVVSEVARSSRVSAQVAVGRLVSDALAAQEARSRGLDRAAAASWAIDVSLARRVPRRLADDARSLGPPTDDELATLTVVHAIVLRSPGVHEERSRAIAEAIHRAVSGARSADEFVARANAVPHAGTQVVVERLQGIGADGHAPKGAEYDPTFVAASFALRTPGEMSWIVESPFGWHTIYLVERSPAEPASVEQRRIDLASDVAVMRARVRIGAIVHARKERSPTEVSEAADALMADATRAP
jgi:hypothetical protein